MVPAVAKTSRSLHHSQWTNHPNSPLLPLIINRIHKRPLRQQVQDWLNLMCMVWHPLNAHTNLAIPRHEMESRAVDLKRWRAHAASRSWDEANFRRKEEVYDLVTTSSCPRIRSWRRASRRTSAHLSLASASHPLNRNKVSLGEVTIRIPQLWNAACTGNDMCAAAQHHPGWTPSCWWPPTQLEASHEQVARAQER
jgi:hypothetical protein